MRSWLPLLIVLLAARARADNDDGIPIGIEAAQSGGAITATVASGAAGYYNPAGLAGVTSDAVDVSANAYGLRLMRVDQPVTGPQGEHGSARVVDWVIAPTLLSYTRRFSPRWFGSFGLFVPKSSDFVVRTNLHTLQQTRWFVMLSERQVKYYTGFSAAVRVRSNLRLGVSLLGSYESDSVTIDNVAGGPDTRTASLLYQNASYGYALTLRAGVQWDPSQHWSLGLSVFAPDFQVWRKLEETAAVTAPDDLLRGGTGFGVQHVVQRGLHHVLAGMPMLRGGIAYRYAHGWIALDGSLTLPLQGDDTQTDRQLDLNLRAGLAHDFSPSWRLGAGVFSDRYTESGDGLDFYGVSMGTTYTRSYELRDGRVIHFVTAVSLRYAYGDGKVTGTTVPSILQGSPSFEFGQRYSDSTSSELSLSIGSGVSF